MRLGGEGEELGSNISESVIVIQSSKPLSQSFGFYATNDTVEPANFITNN